MTKTLEVGQFVQSLHSKAYGSLGIVTETSTTVGFVIVQFEGMPYTSKWHKTDLVAIEITDWDYL